MASYELIDKEKNIAMLTFSAMQMPVFKNNIRGGWVDYGKKNDFPNQLLRLKEEHEEHNAILTSKANYLLGNGFKAKDETKQAFLDEFNRYANRYESWDSINEKIKVDYETFDCTYFQVITDLTGKPKEWYHLQYSNVRTNKDKDIIWYSENWLDRKENQSEFCLFNPESRKPGVFFVRHEFYKPSQNKLSETYSRPQYLACVKSISTDIDISTFNNNYVANGFSAGTLITFFQAEPATEDAKRKLKESILNTYSSPEKAGSIVLAWAGKDGKAPEFSAINIDDLDKKFEFTSKRCLDKIIRGHNVTNPELFGVKTEGQLGTRVSLKESYELMLNTYTKPRQKKVIAWREEIIHWTTGQKIELEIEQLQPIGYDLLSPEAIAVQDIDEVRKTLGLKPKTAPTLDVSGKPIKAQAAVQVNEHLKNMTGKQQQNFNRIISQYKSGKQSKELALISLKNGFGISEDEAVKILGNQDPIKMSAQKTAAEFLLAHFESIDTTSNLELELIEESPVHFHSIKDAIEFEMSMKFKKLLTTKKAGSGFGDLVSGLLGKIGIGNKEPNNPDTPEYKTEIITKYKYALKSDAPALSKGGTSRPFCEKLLAMDKEFTFEQIDSARVAGLTNGFPELDNIFDFRGGYYNNPDTGDIEPFCRHYWKAITYKIKTKV